MQIRSNFPANTGEIHYVAENWKSSAFPSANQRPITAPSFFITWILKRTGWHKLRGLLFFSWDINPILRDFPKISITITSQASLINFFPFTWMWRKGSWSKEGRCRSIPGELVCTYHFCSLCWEISDSILCT